MRKTIYLNEERLYRLVEEVLLELSKHAAPRLPILDSNGEKVFEWDDSKENLYDEDIYKKVMKTMEKSITL